jgi:hypothetical protein
MSGQDFITLGIGLLILGVVMFGLLQVLIHRKFK